MAEVRPFKGIRYDSALGLGEVLCPPYDVISKEQQRELHEVNKFNAIRLEFGLEAATDTSIDNRYTRAASTLEEWIKSGVLVAEEDECYYILEEGFVHLGITRNRTSIVARVKVEEFDKRIVLPHEETSSAPKKDRMQILEATQANLSPIMSIYRDHKQVVVGIIEEHKHNLPIVDVEYQDINIKLWPISDKGQIEQIAAGFIDNPIYLADGHHRYETALKYSQESHLGEQVRDFVMMSLIEIDDPGLLVLPYHRMLRDIAEKEQELLELIQSSFVVVEDKSLNNSKESIEELGVSLERSLSSKSDELQFSVIYDHGSRITTFSMNVELDGSENSLEKCPTWILEQKVLRPLMGPLEVIVDQGKLHFSPDATEVLAGVSSGQYSIGILLPSMPLQLFEEVVFSGERMPIKSTYFSPKLPTGVVINQLK